MFGSLGLPEILFILVIALLVFGPRRLPEIGRTIGKALGEFRRATTELKRSIDTEVTLDEVRQSPPPAPIAPVEPKPVEPPPVEKPPVEEPSSEPAGPAEPAAGEDRSSD
jgi:TatA/E family protein of Tat protein translocase